MKIKHLMQALKKALDQHIKRLDQESFALLNKK